MTPVILFILNNNLKLDIAINLEPFSFNVLVFNITNIKYKLVTKEFLDSRLLIVIVLAEMKAYYVRCSILRIFQANGGIERAVLDAYCWMYSSWNIPQEYKGACTGGDQVSMAPVITSLLI